MFGDEFIPMLARSHNFMILVGSNFCKITYRRF
jgi:hypothetical protein